MLTLLGMLACDKGSGEGGSAFVDDFAGREGVYLSLGPAADPQATPLILHIDASTWAMRQGEEWESASEVSAYDYNLDNGLTVGGFQLLPARLSPGEVGDGVEVLERGEVEVWYGIFEDAVTVAVESGPFAGEHTFARDLGPIRLTHQGAAWELAYYE